MNTFVSLFRNTSFSIMADLFNRVASTVLFIMISRALGVSAAGTFGLAISYFFIGSRFSFWGLDHILTRDVARRHEEAGRYLMHFLLLRLVLAVAAIAGVFVITRMLPYEPQVRAVVLIVALSILPENISNICRSLFMAFERMSYLSAVALLGGVVTLLLGFLFLKAGADILVMAVIFAAASVVTMGVNLFLATTRFARLDWHLDSAFCLRQLRIAFPFIFVGVFFILDNRLDVILLSVLIDEQAVGFYTAAIAIVTALAMLPQGFRTAIFPVLARYQATSIEATTRLFARSFKYLFLLALPMMLGIMLIADEAVHLVYGSAFSPAVPVLRIAVWSFLVYSLTILNTRLLIVNNRQDLVARFLLVSASSTVVLNLFLAPVAGAVGAAIARSISSTILFLLSAQAAWSLLDGFSPWHYLGRPLAAGGIMIGVVLLLKPWGLLAQIPVAVVVYLGALLALGTFLPEEQMFWRRIWLQRN